MKSFAREWLVLWTALTLVSCRVHHYPSPGDKLSETVKLFDNYNKIVEGYVVNLEHGCNALRTNRGTFLFDQQKLYRLKSKARPLRRIYQEFETREKGLRGVGEVLGSIDVVLANYDPWIRYPGGFQTTHRYRGKMCQRRSVSDIIEAEIAEKHPDSTLFVIKKEAVPK